MSSERRHSGDHKDTMETCLDDVEIDEDGNIYLPPSGETDTEAPQSAHGEESEVAANLLYSPDYRDRHSDDNLSDIEQRSLRRRLKDRYGYAGEGAPEEEKEMLAHGARESRPSAGARPGVQERSLDDIELSVFNNSPQETAAETHQPTVHSVERGEREHSTEKSHGLQRLFDIVRNFVRDSSTQRLVLLAVIIVFVVGVILLIGLLPPSFVYVEYYELALTKNRVSGRVNREIVYYPGCYLLTPDTELIRFQGTAHFVHQRLDVSTSDKLSFDVEISLQYFIKPEELGLLFTNYEHDYEDLVEGMIMSTVKNEATKFSLDTFRLNRSVVEADFRRAVAFRLSGDCCPSCCPRQCRSGVDCHSCKTAEQGCQQGIHMDMQYFQMGGIYIPEEVSERFLRQTILVIDAEKENFLQQYAVESKVSEKLQKEILNKAAEIRESAAAEAKRIRAVAEADYERQVQESYLKALKKFYQQLNVTREDHKLSLMYVFALEDMSDNLYNLNFDQLTLYN